VSENTAPAPIETYVLRHTETIRYADTDRQGHVNNAIFATFFESGRVAFLYDPEKPLAPNGSSFVIARLVLDFRAEIHWPGSVAIGTRVASIGRSSFTLAQGIFQKERCVATAETVIVLMDETTRKSTPLTEEIVEKLQRFTGAFRQSNDANSASDRNLEASDRPAHQAPSP
jgi:acyl-CoA thioester hydrolase